MKRQIIKIVLVSLIIFGFFSTAQADTTIHLSIKTPTSTIYDKDITVTPCNSDHGNTETVLATPYCAILQTALPNDWSWYGSGAFLNSVNSIAGFTTKDKTGADVYHYWNWSINGTDGTTGLNEYTLQPSDVISLYFIDPAPDPTPTIIFASGPLITPTPSTTPTPTPTTSSTGAASGTLTTKPSFDIEKAFGFLINEQRGNGSWGEDLYTDWAAPAFASGNHLEPTLKLIRYLEDVKIAGMSITDTERHVMALMSLGLNPYNINGGNYIAKIVSSFDGKQFGDKNEDNDDIFALIVLQNTGYKLEDKIISDDLIFVLSKQKENGSWDESPDLTGAGVEALSVFKEKTEVKNALLKAKDYLKQNQKDNGGWNNNASSTAWALEGILALGEKPEDWVKNNNSPLDYLATIQDTDGGVKDESISNKIWETTYVLTALSGKSWNQVLQNFEKPITPALVTVKNNPTKQNMLIVKSENKIQNTATVIEAVSDTPPATGNNQPNWFLRLLRSIFGLN